MTTVRSTPLEAPFSGTKTQLFLGGISFLDLRLSFLNLRSLFHEYN